MDGFHCHLQEISLKFSIFPNLLGSPIVSEPFFGAMSGGWNKRHEGDYLTVFLKALVERKTEIAAELLLPKNIVNP